MHKPRLAAGRTAVANFEKKIQIILKDDDFSIITLHQISPTETCRKAHSYNLSVISVSRALARAAGARSGAP